jgi:hypothetical protein
MRPPPPATVRVAHLRRQTNTRAYGRVVRADPLRPTTTTDQCHQQCCCLCSNQPQHSDIKCCRCCLVVAHYQHHCRRHSVTSENHQVTLRQQGHCAEAKNLPRCQISTTRQKVGELCSFPGPEPDVAASQHVQDMGGIAQNGCSKTAPHKLVSRYQTNPLQCDSQGPVVSKSLECDWQVCA